MSMYTMSVHKKIFSVASAVAISLGFIGLLGASAQENQVPTVVSVYLSATAGAQTDAYPGGTINNLSPGGGRTVHINGIVEDLDGRDDISFVSGTFRRSGATNGSNCTADNNDCYRVATCSLSNNEDANQKEYNCSMSLQSYIDSTVPTTGRYPAENWIIDVYVEDVQTDSGADSSVSKEVGEVMDLSIPSPLDFGIFDVGDQTDSLNNIEQVFSQNGNVVVDVEVYATAPQSCLTGEIPVGNHQWSLNDLPYDATGTTVLTGTPADTNLALSYRDDDTTNITKSLFWNIKIPDTNISGECSGVIIITSIAG